MVSQSTWTVGALFLMFFAWIASRGQLSTYMGFFGLTSGQSAAQAGNSAAMPANASATTKALGTLDPSSAAAGTAAGNWINQELQPGHDAMQQMLEDNTYDPAG